MSSDHAVLVIALAGLLAVIAPATAEAQFVVASQAGATVQVPESPVGLGSPTQVHLDPELAPWPEPPTDMGYRRAVRLYGFAAALTTLGLAGVAVGAATWDNCSSSSWFCINPGPVFMGAGAIVGLHGLILFIIAGAVNGKASRRESAHTDSVEIDVDVRVSANEAGLALSGSF